MAKKEPTPAKGEDKVYTCHGPARHGCGGGAHVLSRMREEMKKTDLIYRWPRRPGPLLPEGHTTSTRASHQLQRTCAPARREAHRAEPQIHPCTGSHNGARISRR